MGMWRSVSGIEGAEAEAVPGKESSTPPRARRARVRASARSGNGSEGGSSPPSASGSGSEAGSSSEEEGGRWTIARDADCTGSSAEEGGDSSGCSGEEDEHAGARRRRRREAALMPRPAGGRSHVSLRPGMRVRTGNTPAWRRDTILASASRLTVSCTAQAAQKKAHGRIAGRRRAAGEAAAADWGGELKSALPQGIEALRLCASPPLLHTRVAPRSARTEPSRGRVTSRTEASSRQLLVLAIVRLKTRAFPFPLSPFPLGFFARRYDELFERCQPQPGKAPGYLYSTRRPPPAQTKAKVKAKANLAKKAMAEQSHGSRKQQAAAAAAVSSAEPVVPGNGKLQVGTALRSL